MCVCIVRREAVWQHHFLTPRLAWWVYLWLLGAQLETMASSLQVSNSSVLILRDAGIFYRFGGVTIFLFRSTGNRRM